MTPSQTCTHTESYLPEPFEVYAGYELHTVQPERQERSTFRDIDLHRCGCTKCGEIMFYSRAARQFYEHGIERPDLGLSK